MDTSRSEPAVSGIVVTSAPMLRLAVAAYLARFNDQSRVPTESDLRAFLLWCEERELDAFSATRPHLELYVRWLQEVRRFRPSTVSRPMSVVAGFYRTCVIDGVCGKGGKGGKVVLVPLPPAVSRAIERSVHERATGAIPQEPRRTSHLHLAAGM